MKQNFIQYAVLAVAFLLESCVSAPSVYFSSVPEDRAERAILSNIDFIGEISTNKNLSIGVFLSHETSIAAVGDFVLFAFKQQGLLGGASAYSLETAGSISSDQAAELLRSLKEYSAKSPKDFAIGHIYNFELYAGVLDNAAVGQRRFGKTTFAMIFSVSSSAKALSAFFPGRNGLLVEYKLKDSAVTELVDILGAALARVPTPTSGTSNGSKTDSKS